MSPESYLAPSGVPMDDVRIQLALEPLVRVELAAAVELVLQVAEDLLGGGVVQAVALAAHGLAGACVCSIESGPCERVESLQMSGRF